MYKGRLKPHLAILVVICMFVTLNLAYADTESSGPYLASPDDLFDEPSATGMMVDLLVLRPLGIVATALGTALFIVALPFTLPTGSVKQAAKKLVAEPASYTFGRPLGQP